MRNCLIATLTVLVLAGSNARAEELRAKLSDGRGVILKEDGTWVFAPTPEVSRDKDAELAYEGKHKSFALHLKPGVWNKADKPTNPVAEVMFVHKSNDIYAMIIAERVAAPLEVLKKAAFDNMRSVDKNVQIVEEEARKVGGVDVLCVTSKLTSQGIPLVFHNYYYAGKAGMIQIITWTSENLYEESKAEMDNFLNGFVLLKK